MRAPSSRKASALKPSPWGSGFRKQILGGQISLQQTPHLVIGLLRPQPGRRSITQVNGREGQWEALTSEVPCVWASDLSPSGSLLWPQALTWGLGALGTQVDCPKII